MNDHPLTYDRWATQDDPEFGVVRVDNLRKMERACQGIWAIARVVGNNGFHAADSDSRPLDPWVVSSLVGSMESLCDQLSHLIEGAIASIPN